MLTHARSKKITPRGSLPGAHNITSRSNRQANREWYADFLTGMEEAIRRLNPSRILFYGKIPKEYGAVAKPEDKQPLLGSKKNGALGGGRTHNLHLRRVALYPIELRVHAIQ